MPHWGPHRYFFHGAVARYSLAKIPVRGHMSDVPNDIGLMLNIEHSLSHARHLKAHHRWFADSPQPADIGRLAFYYHCRRTANLPGFIRTPKYTKLIDLTRGEEHITAGFNKSTRYEVRRAVRENLTVGTVEDAAVFSEFYNGFAASKGHAPLNAADLRRYWPHVVVLQAMRENEPLVMHAYLIDRDAGRGLMLHSASQFRNLDDNETRRLVGRANRFLHHQAMLWMREQGLRTYDFGGYALGTTDPQLKAINYFKDNFGGELVEESNYASIALTLLRGFKQLLRRRAG